MICFIPTKGRLNTKTYKLFEAVGIEVYHFIEPQEIDPETAFRKKLSKQTFKSRSKILPNFY
jgi:ATP phosphoribosyltransferase